MKSDQEMNRLVFKKSPFLRRRSQKQAESTYHMMWKSSFGRSKLLTSQGTAMMITMSRKKLQTIPLRARWKQPLVLMKPLITKWILTTTSASNLKSNNCLRLLKHQASCQKTRSHSNKLNFNPSSNRNKEK